FIYLYTPFSHNITALWHCFYFKTIIKLFVVYNTTQLLNILSKFAKMNDFMLFFNIFKQHIYGLLIKSTSNDALLISKCL
ncbi:MAG TPA: hypothetical protein PLV83_01535, partial [Bacilli bacterium]|nr:hypothetical protein [Bacilli bacterium]